MSRRAHFVALGQAVSCLSQDIDMSGVPDLDDINQVCVVFPPKHPSLMMFSDCRLHPIFAAKYV
jgi:hypothetical protein